MLASQTVGELKRAIAMPLGISAGEQRLFVRSCLLADARPLSHCGLALESPEVMLVPKLTHRAAGGVAPIPARRGFNMVPGSTPWQPSKVAQIGYNDLRLAFDDGPPVRKDALLALSAPPAVLAQGLDPTRPPPDETILLQRSF